MVAQVDKQHTAMVANTMAPAGQTNDLVDVALPERAAGVGPVTMHGYSKNKCRRVESGTRGLPEEAEGLPEAFGRGNRPTLRQSFLMVRRRISAVSNHEAPRRMPGLVLRDACLRKLLRMRA